jgi:hypothetical protein
MRTIYLDTEFRCHVADDGTMMPLETDYFDGMCDAYVEGFRYVPKGETWERGDGTVFQGTMITPWVLDTVLDQAQREYERERLAEYEAMSREMDTAYQEGVNSI